MNQGHQNTLNNNYLQGQQHQQQQQQQQQQPLPDHDGQPAAPANGLQALQDQFLAAAASTTTVEARRYRVLNLIGKGSYGVVCAARDESTGEVVAIKKIQNVFENVADAHRILREITLLRLLKHPDIVEIKHIMLPSDPNKFKDLYVVFELMESDLHTVIGANDDLTRDHHKVFLYQLLRGLNFMHTNRVLHRDLKPKNILANSNCKLKICDFGLARPCMGLGASSQSPVMWTDYVATRWYRAPELCGCFFGQYNGAVDIWSVGCIFAEILLGRPLFPAKDAAGQLHLITDLLGTPPPLFVNSIYNPKALTWMQALKWKAARPFDEVFPNADPLALDLLARMLAFDPANRPTPAAALAHPYFRDLPSAVTQQEVPVLENFPFEHADKLSEAGVRQLIYREVLNYHPHVRAAYEQQLENMQREMALAAAAALAAATVDDDADPDFVAHGDENFNPAVGRQAAGPNRGGRGGGAGPSSGGGGGIGSLDGGRIAVPLEALDLAAAAPSESVSLQFLHHHGMDPQGSQGSAGSVDSEVTSGPPPALCQQLLQQQQQQQYQQQQQQPPPGFGPSAQQQQQVAYGSGYSGAAGPSAGFNLPAAGAASAAAGGYCAPPPHSAYGTAASTGVYGAPPPAYGAGTAASSYAAAPAYPAGYGVAGAPPPPPAAAGGYGPASMGAAAAGYFPAQAQPQAMPLPGAYAARGDVPPPPPPQYQEAWGYAPQGQPQMQATQPPPRPTQPQHPQMQVPMQLLQQQQQMRGQMPAAAAGGLEYYPAVPSPAAQQQQQHRLPQAPQPMLQHQQQLLLAQQQQQLYQQQQMLLHQQYQQQQQQQLFQQQQQQHGTPRYESAAGGYDHNGGTY